MLHLQKPEVGVTHFRKGFGRVVLRKVAHL